MCDNVCVHDNGRSWATNQGELVALLGGALVRAEGCSSDAYTDGSCLCPVDVVATAEKYGYVATRDDPTTGEYDPFDVHFVRARGKALDAGKAQA